MPHAGRMRTLLVPALAGAVIVVTGAVGMALSAPDDPAERPAVTEHGPGEAGEPASDRGRERRQAAREFVAAKQEWLTCVADARAAQDEPGPLDREEACGEKPRPQSAAGRPRGGHGREDAPGQRAKDR